MLNENQEKLNKLSTFAKNAELANFGELQAIADSLKVMAEKEMPENKLPEVFKVELPGVKLITIKGDDGDDPTDEHLLELITPLIPPAIKGDSYILTAKDKKEIAKSIDVPIVEKIIEKTEIIKEQPIVTNEVKEVAITETAEQIIDKINEDESEKKIKREKVEGLDDEFKRIDKSISSIPRGGGGGRASHSTKFYKLTPDGSTKIFSVPKSVTSIILMSDFPHVLFEGSANGFTINANRTQITLTTDNAPSVSSQLLYQYSEVFNT